jgi:translation initiation factor 2 subunit 2
VRTEASIKENGEKYNMEEYDNLLKRGRSQVPKDAFDKSGERFQVPDVQLIVQGNRTIWQNFQEIVDVLNRPGKEVLKYVSGQLATAGTIEGGNAIFNGKFYSHNVQDVLEEYIQDYVICPVCGRPDTHMEKEKNAYYLRCSACGARTSIRPV